MVEFRQTKLDQVSSLEVKAQSGIKTEQVVQTHQVSSLEVKAQRGIKTEQVAKLNLILVKQEIYLFYFSLSSTQVNRSASIA